MSENPKSESSGFFKMASSIASALTSFTSFIYGSYDASEDVDDCNGGTSPAAVSSTDVKQTFEAADEEDTQLPDEEHDERSPILLDGAVAEQQEEPEKREGPGPSSQGPSCSRIAAPRHSPTSRRCNGHSSARTPPRSVEQRGQSSSSQQASTSGCAPPPRRVVPERPDQYCVFEQPGPARKRTLVPFDPSRPKRATRRPERY